VHGAGTLVYRMDTKTIRQAFIDFFVARGHKHVPSSSLLPNDPTLLLTNAGMNQFKPYFLGEQNPPYERAVTVQKCMRAGGKHNDLEEVGHTNRHLTFFEMLGNFSFGEYYKEEACNWGWELVTEAFGLDPDRLWATVYTTDDEAERIWIDSVGVRPERVLRRGKEDNFWSMGVAGPCGPCSEIFVDLGDRFGEASQRGPDANEDRYVEIWNLVFMQNDCNAAIEPVDELPKKNIDTGAGLERIAMVLQGKDSVFEADILASLIEQAGELTGHRYGRDEKADVMLRILADHARSVTFMVGDGILPSNEERGYVLRRIIRRAARYARLVGSDRPIFPAMIQNVVDHMGDAYPEIQERKDFIIDIASNEEERFTATLKQGLILLEEEIGRLPKGEERLPGDVAFKLHDTFGFPIDLTREIAAESSLSIDQDRFEKLMTEQRERARAARRSEEGRPAAESLAGLAEELGATEFLGFEHLVTGGHVLGLARGAEGVPVLTAGTEGEIVLDRTAFYAEGGGQVADRGVIRGSSGTAEVLDVQRIASGLIGHFVKVTEGEFKVGDEVEGVVDGVWRAGSQRAHTATHVLHWLLRDRLGDHATQKGSLVEPGRLRFDFNHFEPLGEERMAEFGEELETKVLVDDPVRAYETSFEYARSIGAMAIFGEKYGDFVRVVEVGEYSKELCGGTHVPHTSQIGLIVITGEGSVGANLRRVQALVGRDGLEHLQRKVAVLERAAELLKTNPDEVAERIERVLATQKDLERRVGEIERQSATSDAEALGDAAVDVDGTRLVVARRDGEVDALRSLAQQLKGRLGSAVIVLGTAGEGRANLVGAVSKDLVERGISARDLLAPGAALLGGGAGGKPDLAISGGPAADKIEEAIQAVAQAARDALNK
jgi:alanyl-tRNA synthetase